MHTFSSFALSPSPTPASVPPVPTEQVNPSIRPSICVPDFLGGADDMRAAIGDIVELVGPDRVGRLLGDAARLVCTKCAQLA